MKKTDIYLYNFKEEILELDPLGNYFNIYTLKDEEGLSEKINGIILVNTKEINAKMLDITSKIKTQNPSVPIIVIYSICSEENLIRSFRAGIRDFFKRPFEMKQLLFSINALVEMCGSVLTKKRNNVFLDNLNLHVTSKVISKKEITYPGIERVIKFIEENYSEDICLDQMSEKARISKFHLCRLFKKHTGYSCNKYLNAVRIGKAKEYLMDQTRTVTDVAFLVGYSDLSHFERVFKNLVGFPPNIYRRKQAVHTKTNNYSNISSDKSRVYSHNYA